jgi:hypothetical protein
VRFSFVQSQRAIVKHLKTSDIFWPQSGDCSAQQHSWHDHNWGYSEPWRAKDHVLFAILEDVAEASTCREREQTQFVSSFLQVLFWVCSVFNQTKQANCLLWIADYVMKMSMWWICLSTESTVLWIQEWSQLWIGSLWNRQEVIASGCRLGTSQWADRTSYDIWIHLVQSV